MTGPLMLLTGADTPAPPTAINRNTMLQVVREAASCLVEIFSGGGAPGLLFRRKEGTLAAPAPVTANSSMGVIRWQTKPASGADDRTTAQIQVTARSAETQDGFFDGQMTLTLVGAKTGQSNSFFTLQNLADTGTTATIGADAFVCSADAFVCSAKNFTVNASGGVTAATGITVQSGGLIVATGSVVAASINTTRSGEGVGGRFAQKDVDSAQTGYGVVGGCEGISLTTGSVAGVRGESTGTCNVGIGVVGVATGNANQNYGLQAIASGAAINIGLYIGPDVTRAAGSYAISSQSSADTFLRGPLGLNFATPTHQLEVGGTTMLRGTCEIAGNITSSGTAHSFAANSIPSSAVVGSASFTPANSAAAGVAGSVRWDENFLYVRVASGWKRVALTAF
jgi:hypothetical protein